MINLQELTVLTKRSMNLNRKLQTERKQLMQKSFLQNWRESILEKYKVKVNPRAIRELDSIYEYIANEKSAPENAKGQDIITNRTKRFM